jgi:hypothetical protein
MDNPLKGVGVADLSLFQGDFQPNYQTHLLLTEPTFAVILNLTVI